MNRRLSEIQDEKRKFEEMLDKSESIYDSLAYQGKLDMLEEEEKQILERTGG